jgi:hypothetical protein
MHRIAAAVAVMLFAGCFGEPDKGEMPSPIIDPLESDPGGNDPNRETIPLEPLPNGTIPEAPAHLILESCSMWRAYHSILPTQYAPGQVPEGWTTNDPIVTVGVTGFSCGRIGLGNFERGPIEILFESHNKGVVPNECPSVTSDSLHSILGQVVVNDADVAQFLNETYGMPVLFGQIEQAVQELPAGRARTVSWTVGNGDESSVNIVEDDATIEKTQVERFWWTRGTGMGQLALDLAMVGPEFGDRAGYGKFVEPMAMAQVADGEFAGLAVWYSTVTTTNNFELYSDHFCTPA